MNKHHGELNTFLDLSGKSILDELTPEEIEVLETSNDMKLISDDEIKAALKNSEGDIAEAANEIGCSEATVYLRADFNSEVDLLTRRSLAPKSKYTQEQMILAITKAEGNITNAAGFLDCSRITVKKHIARYPEVREVFLDENDKITDIAWSGLVNSIKREEPWAIQFYYREYWPRYVSPVRGDSGRFPAMLPIDESYDPDLNRLTNDELTQLDELATLLTEDPSGAS